MATPGQIQEVARHFVIAAIWADAPEGTNPRTHAKANAAAFNICKHFIDENHYLFLLAMQAAENGYGSHPDACSAEASFGHDLYLTLACHGCGFWDRDELGRPLGEALTQACKESKYNHLQAVDFYRGWIYIQD